MNSHLQQLFSHAYILGGSPCSGKSTIAEMLSAKYAFHYYKADDHESEHMQRSQPENQPTMFKYSKMGWDEIWSQPPKKLSIDEITYYRERFPFILEDLFQLDSEKPLILEGTAFLPELIKQYPLKRENVVFLIPSFEFQIQHYGQRPWIESILNQCHDPKQAFENWMKRDELFGQEVIRQAESCGFEVLLVDGSVDIQGQFERIEIQFKF